MELDLSFSKKEPGSTSRRIFSTAQWSGKKIPFDRDASWEYPSVAHPSFLMDRHLSPAAFYGAI